MMIEGWTVVGVISRYWQFLKDVRSELRKVVWPDANETTIYTMVVLLATCVVAVVFFVADTAFGGGIRFIIAG